MKKFAVVALVVGGMWSTAGLAQATHVAIGQTCGLSSSTAPSSPNVQAGSMQGGPVTATIPGAWVRIDCWIHVGAENSTHTGIVAEGFAATNLQTITVGPVPKSYEAPVGKPVYLCTEWTVNGTTYYYDGTGGAFSLLDSVDCAQSISQETGPSTSHTVAQVPANV